LKLFTAIEIQLYDGTKGSATVEVHSRQGTKSPELYLIIYKGKRYTPYEQALGLISLTWISVAKMYYDFPKMKDLIYAENPLLALIPKTTGICIAQVSIPKIN
jgi:hypothetical protein